MHHLALRIVALVAALVMALPVGAFAQGKYFCRGMNLVMETCCCGSHEDEPADSCTEVKPTGCCERLPGADRQATPAVRDAGMQIPQSALVLTLSPLTPVVADHGRVLGGTTKQARAPPPLGPPLFIKNCTLLS